MVKELFSMFGDYSKKDPSVKELNERNLALNQKLGLLNPEQREVFRKELIDILEWKDRCVVYGAKDPAELPASDVLIIRESLYKKLHSS